MDTSVTIIGLIITILIGIPITLVFRSNITNRAKIKDIKKQYSQNNHYNFEHTETQNKKILSIDQKNKGFLLIDFSYKKDTAYFVDLKNIILCNLLTTNESKSNTVSKVEIELVHKNSMKKELIPIYNIENQYLDFNCLFEDHKLAQKWVGLINKTI
ncbi:hypothetical protein [Flavobacterium aquicola]|uniref:Uncharacterized protein n=1 Tax=Flavobacterium aquicola TaxID=1682742 RepID=A0A3E0ESH3_9FLAO|nr:hypothetical protein [Flavobacterium aquicola]REH01086.1 hypothetical protein C8P67_102344 [Flavobacterium aquicola]